MLRGLSPSFCMGATRLSGSRRDTEGQLTQLPAPTSSSSPPHALLILSDDALIETCNSYLLEVLTRSPQETYGKSVSTLFAEPGAGEAFMDQLREELAQREYAIGTFRLRVLNGGIVPMSYQATLMSIPRQGERYYLVIAQDERGSRERRTNLQNVAQFSEEIPFPALRVSPEGMVLYANRGSWLLLEHWQCGVGQLVPAQWREKVRAALQQRDNLEVEVAIGFKTLLLVLVPVPQNGYLDIFGLDVTGRKQAEKKILFHSQVFESTTEGIVITDADRRIIDVNRAFTTITGTRRTRSSVRISASCSRVGMTRRSTESSGTR